MDDEAPSSDWTTPLQPEIQVDLTWDDDAREIIRWRTADLDQQISRAVLTTLSHRGFISGWIGIFLTNDETIREVNRNHLSHDYATDVISFAYQLNDNRVEGELTASVEMAANQSERIGWPFHAELLLYVVHGTLHITGMDDHTLAQRAEMRAAEQAILVELGIDEVNRFDADRFDALSGTSIAEEPASSGEAPR